MKSHCALSHLRIRVVRELVDRSKRDDRVAIERRDVKSAILSRDSAKREPAAHVTVRSIYEPNRTSKRPVEDN